MSRIVEIHLAINTVRMPFTQRMNEGSERFFYGIKTRTICQIFQCLQSAFFVFSGHFTDSASSLTIAVVCVQILAMGKLPVETWNRARRTNKRSTSCKKCVPDRHCLCVHQLVFNTNENENGNGIHREPSRFKAYRLNASQTCIPLSLFSNSIHSRIAITIN